jgi:hypothetical protein
MRQHIALGSSLVLAATLVVQTISPSQQQPLPSGPLTYGLIAATFAADGTFTLGDGGWPNFAGTWKAAEGVAEFALTSPPNGCAEPGRFRYHVEGRQVRFELIADACMERRMMLVDSVWLPEGETPVSPSRRIVRTGPVTVPELAPASAAEHSWPSFRGPQASGIAADGQNLLEKWSGPAGKASSGARRSRVLRTQVP